MAVGGGTCMAGTSSVKEDSVKEDSPLLGVKEDSPLLGVKEDSPLLGVKEDSPLLGGKEDSPPVSQAMPLSRFMRQILPVGLTALAIGVTRPLFDSSSAQAEERLEVLCRRPSQGLVEKVTLADLAECRLDYVECAAVIGLFCTHVFGTLTEESCRSLLKKQGVLKTLGVEKLPRTSYKRLVEVWIGGCLLLQAGITIDRLADFCAYELEYRPAQAHNGCPCECFRKIPLTRRNYETRKGRRNHGPHVHDEFLEVPQNLVGNRAEIAALLASLNQRITFAGFLRQVFPDGQVRMLRTLSKLKLERAPKRNRHSPSVTVTPAPPPSVAAPPPSATATPAPPPPIPLTQSLTDLAQSQTFIPLTPCNAYWVGMAGVLQALDFSPEQLAEFLLAFRPCDRVQEAVSSHLWPVSMPIASAQWVLADPASLSPEHQRQILASWLQRPDPPP
ncbi:hypothetical protein GNI_164850 [Gregarina niphandrodes]|uniref:Uncharacterized protein n=1 Tax=Gregarina niphandrodes TaxID=110365 RepID=A0A023AY74_GRENI|nr:hypothetical protein GNI_164850 [Gregarina niphandrodes]EZG43609.1 hypothetical protein GNI_164850 [Gregarina niphandrodes]|eukprot:XP_011133163.1 hypothetical protein GNI_164850 [Gregarina niphandrodes]